MTCIVNTQCPIQGQCCSFVQKKCTKNSASCVSDGLTVIGNICSTNSQCQTGCCSKSRDKCSFDDCKNDQTTSEQCSLNSQCPQKGMCCSVPQFKCGQGRNCILHDNRVDNFYHCDLNQECASGCCDNKFRFCNNSKDDCLGDVPRDKGILAVSLILGSVILLLIISIIIIVCCIKKRKRRRKRQQMKKQINHSHYIEEIQPDSNQSNLLLFKSMLDFGDALKIKGNYLDFEHTEEKRIPVIIKKPNGKGIIQFIKAKENQKVF